MAEKGSKGLSVKKNENFSEWYSEVVQKAELADLRYNVKGFVIFQPWAVLAMEAMYSHFQRRLQANAHKPYFFPTVIPESNLKKESAHLAGFTPEVFWIGEAGDGKLDERLALRPTSETAFYQMFSLWLRSYKQLPFKTYQRANVFRYETKATRPFFRSREFHWIETHCLFKTREDAVQQVHEDMETTQEVLHDTLGLPFIFFERPIWDKFPGADSTFAADVLNPDGRFVQQPSTHLISQNFIKAFNVTFKDADGAEKVPFVTCYGPAISRIMASIISVHGDDKGLRFPWAIAPVHVMLVPLSLSGAPLKKAQEIAKTLRSEFGEAIRVDIDTRDVSFGEKFNTWEFKGVPLRIDIGEKEIDAKKVSVFRRDNNTKTLVSEKDIVSYVRAASKEFDTVLMKQADTLFEGRIENAKSMPELVRVIEAGKVGRCMFCSVDKDGAKCADSIKEQTSAHVRGTKLEKEKASGMCVACGKKASAVVYIGRSY